VAAARTRSPATRSAPCSPRSRPPTRPSRAGSSTSAPGSASTSTSSSTVAGATSARASPTATASTSFPRSQEADRMTELLVGTRKGLFVLEGEPGGPFEVEARAFAGQSVEYATRDPRSGRYLASVTSWFYGPKVWVADDPAGEWEQGAGLALPEGSEGKLERIWVIAPGEQEGLVYAGGDPGVLFESRDGGLTWKLNAGLWEHETRSRWQPGNGGLCLHTIVPWPGDPNRLLVAISAVGVWLSDDGGKTWRHSNTGIVPDYVPEEARDNPIQHCVHHVRR